MFNYVNFNNLILASWCSFHLFYAHFKPGIERVQTLADISRSHYVVIATKPMHELQIRPVVHN